MKAAKSLEELSPLEIVDIVEKRGKGQLKELSRIAKGRIHSKSTKKKVAAPIGA
jgi:hypothetical protein